MNWKNEYNHLEYKAVKAFWGASTSCWNRPASFMACWKRTESHDWCEIFRWWSFSAWYVATIWIGSSHIISPKWLLVDFFSHISTLNHQWSWNHTWYSSPSQYPMLQWVANSDAEISSQWPWPIDTHNGYNPQSRFHLKPQVPGCAASPRKSKENFLVPLGWHPCCLTPQKKPFKRDIPHKYPLQ